MKEVQKFMPATKENVERHTLEHFDELFQSQKESKKKLFKGIEEMMPTDEHIKGYIKNKFLNPEYMSHHDTIIPDTGYDYYDIVKEIQGIQNEKLLIILLDKNKNILEHKIVKEGTENRLDNGRTYWDEFKYLLSNENAYYFITVHNHPNAISAFPSSGDIASAYNEAMLGNIFGVKALDSCIITEYDYYSQAEEDKSLQNNQKILYPTISKEVSNILFDKEQMLYRFIKRMVDGGL